MFHIDPNVNAAVQRQMERVCAVRAYQGGPQPERSVEDNREPRWIQRRAVLALAAAAPIAVLVAAVVLLTR